MHVCFRAGHACGTRTVRACLFLRNQTTHADTWENAGLRGGRRSTAMPSTTSSSVARSVPPPPPAHPRPHPPKRGSPRPPLPLPLSVESPALSLERGGRRLCSEGRGVNIYAPMGCLNVWHALLSHAASCRPLADRGCGFVGFRSSSCAGTMGKTRSSV